MKKLIVVGGLFALSLAPAAFAAKGNHAPRRNACVRAAENAAYAAFDKSDAAAQAKKEDGEHYKVFGDSYQQINDTTVEIDIEYGDSREDDGETLEATYSVPVSAHGAACTAGTPQLKK